ncbi:MAG: ABC transporter ATP-binding protein [Gemmatales bacterium]|nr:energy-coupling factor ABC transporter ATP-binding protein [Gemmatales bacterium]MDW7994521.1 ABC transporter ATP-binding protein [Gemmatales bacterium]
MSWILEVQGLSYTWPGGFSALEDVTFQVTTGESVAVVGPNGAGKTTLLLCLAGVVLPQRGQIRIAGFDPRDSAQRQQIPRKVGLVFSDSDDQLIHWTVYDDVAFGPLNLGLPEAEVRRRVQRALQAVGLEHAAFRVPFHLSSGEKKRAALAGVLAMEPEILLLDEPTLHLDPRARRELIRILNRLDVTKLIASHDLEFNLAICQRAFVLDQGRLVADGPIRKLFANASLMEAHGLEVPLSLVQSRDPLAGSAS